MNTIDRLTIKLAEMTLAPAHASQADVDELRALLIAARSDRLGEANDPPEWPQEAALLSSSSERHAGRPFEAQDADHAARLGCLKRDSNVLAYAEKLRASMAGQGLDFSLADTIAVAKDMLRPVATAVAADTDAPDGAYRYLRNVFEISAPQSTSLPDLMGLCTQIDNLIAGYRSRIAELEAPKPSEPTEDAREEAERLVERLGVFSWHGLMKSHTIPLQVRRHLAAMIVEYSIQRRPAAPMPAVPRELLERLPPLHIMAGWCNVGWIDTLTNEHLRALHDLLALLRAAPKPAQAMPTVHVQDLTNLIYQATIDAQGFESIPYGLAKAIARAVLSAIPCAWQGADDKALIIAQTLPSSVHAAAVRAVFPTTAAAYERAAAYVRRAAGRP